MIEKEIIEALMKKLKEEIMVEIKSEIAENKKVKILDREAIMKKFNCGRTKMNEIMHSKDKPPVVYIGGEYYSTEKQMKLYFDSKMGYKKYQKPITRYNTQEMFDSELNLLYKEDLMDMFKMGRTKFKKFIDSKDSPIKIIGQGCYVTSDKLQTWFYDNEGRKIDID